MIAVYSGIGPHMISHDQEAIRCPAFSKSARKIQDQTSNCPTWFAVPLWEKTNNPYLWSIHGMILIIFLVEEMSPPPSQTAFAGLGGIRIRSRVSWYLPHKLTQLFGVFQGHKFAKLKPGTIGIFQAISMRFTSTFRRLSTYLRTRLSCPIFQEAWLI